MIPGDPGDLWRWTSNNGLPPPSGDDTNRRHGTGQDEATGVRSGITAASGQRPMTISGGGRRSG